MDEASLRDIIGEIDIEARSISNSVEDYGELIEESMRIVKNPPRDSSMLDGNVVVIDGFSRYAFVGDLHGDYTTLIGLLSTNWDLLKDSLIVFLGDYIDRGLYQVETLVFVLLLKRKLRDQVIILRGNHEPPSWLIPHPHDYAVYLEKRFKQRGDQLYENTLRLFNEIPIAAIKENHFIALHGGPPLKVLESSSIREVFHADTTEEYNKILEEVLWSDPVDFEYEYTISPRGAGVLYGPVITNRVLSLINGKFLIRGHEAVDGFKTNHRGRVITVFTSPLVYGFRCGGLLVYEIKSSDEADLRKLCYDPRRQRVLTLNNS